MKKRYFAYLLTLAFCINSFFFTAAVQAAGMTSFDTIISDEAINRGIAVASDGSIYALCGSQYNSNQSLYLNRYNASETLIQQVDYPNRYAKELAGSPNGAVIVGCGYSSGDLSIYAPGWSYVKTIGGNTLGNIQAITFDASGNFYAILSYTGSGTKCLRLQKLNASNVSSLKSAAKVTWDKEYDVTYTAPGGTYYIVGIAADAIGNVYIADAGSSNGYDSSVNGIIRYHLTTKKATTMFFTSDPVYKLTWVHGVASDAAGLVTAKAKGKATISAATWGGAVKKTCEVTVTEKMISTKKPSVPVISNARSAGYNSVKVTWKSASGATGYSIYRASTKGGNYSKVGTSNTTSYTDSKLTTGKNILLQGKGNKQCRKQRLFRD